MGCGLTRCTRPVASGSQGSAELTANAGGVIRPSKVHPLRLSERIRWEPDSRHPSISKPGFRELHDLFQELVHGQNPETLFITCSDSRIDPNRLPIRCPGIYFCEMPATCPPHGVNATGESATIEFAVAGLGVKDIIVCGTFSLCNTKTEPKNRTLSRNESVRRQ